ncbi:MAG: PfkB family carbohydrate kinase [Desulfurococcaceae archaeon]|jgi:sugar/nucleoside kinase (ribokinase family)|nr:PfkB family carbohydrate kinase [Desulfurococcaceae archaeon]
MKALLVGNLTIDIIEGSVYRVGGTGFYGGRALAEGFGVKVYVLSNVDKSYRSLVTDTMSSYGIEVIDIESESMPLFIIVKGKAREFKGASPTIPINLVKDYIESLNPEIILLVPIMRELDIDAISIVRQHFKGVLSIDIQGFVRAVKNSMILCVWSEDLEKSLVLVDVVHGNISEFCFSDDEMFILRKVMNMSTTCNTLYLVSLDQRGTYAIHKGEIFYIPPLSITPLDDVGAGDILLAITSYYMAKGEDVLQATVKGVIAASLKVANAYTKWFNRNDIESRYAEHMNKVRVPSI